jgi:hypothetical protein
MQSFVSLQIDYWDGPWQSRQGFLSALSKRAKVLFVSPPLHLEHVIDRRTRPPTRMKGLQRIEGSLWSYVPPRILPVNYRLPKVEQVFQQLRDWHLRSVCKRLSLEAPATLVFNPYLLPEKLANVARPLIYYKYDHYAGYAGVPAEQQRFMDDSEERLFREADLIFVTSVGLFDLHVQDAPGRIHLLPNGVDYAAFSNALRSGLTEPDDLATIPRPRLGYVGQVNAKVDFRLLRELATRRRSYSFVLAGPYRRSRDEACDLAFDALLAEPNVHYLGPKPHREVPGYLAGLDAGLMPYVVTEWVRFGYPLKLHEYLAVGLPSVSSMLPELEPFRDVVTLAATTDEWLQAIDAAVIVRDDPALFERRRAVARDNSWEVRVDKFLAAIEAWHASRPTDRWEAQGVNR